VQARAMEKIGEVLEILVHPDAKKTPEAWSFGSG
jgi:hypothetical protein